MKFKIGKIAFGHLSAILFAAVILVRCGGEHKGNKDTSVADDPINGKTPQEEPVVGSAGVLDSAAWFNMTPPKDHITATELKTYQQDFQNHFFIRYKDERNNDVDMPLLNSRREVRWDKFKALFDDHLPQAVAVMISYGQAENSFVPVFEFLALDGVGLKVIPNSAYIYEDGKDAFHKLANATPTPCETLTDAYSSNVKVIRKAGAGSTDLVKGTDPHAIIFPWNTKFAALMNDNPLQEDRVIVLTCIAVETSLIPGGEVEFRHGLAAYVARPKDVQGAIVLFDALKDSPETTANGAPTYRHLAMDLGTLCPPNCPKR